MTEHPRRFDSAAVERAFSELIRSLGLDAATEPELARTPRRVAAMLREVLSGLEPDRELDLAVFPSDEGSGGDLVVIRDLPFHSLCVHHFVPFFGHATVAYLADRSWAGLSGIGRLVDHYARRPQLQERLNRQIADHLERALQPRGVFVGIRARHLCMEMRGLRRRAIVETRVVRGELGEPRWAAALPGGGGEAVP